METLVLLVFLAIVWAAVGIYWLRTRAPQASMSLGGYGRRLGALDSMTSRKPAPVVALRSIGSNVGRSASGISQIGTGVPSGRPGHSLTDPARRASPGASPMPQSGRSTSSEQARLRRRNVLVGLVAAAVLTLVGIFVVGWAGIVLVHLVADAALLGFVMLLLQYQRAIAPARTRTPHFGPLGGRHACEHTRDAHTRTLATLRRSTSLYVALRYVTRARKDNHPSQPVGRIVC